ncbi:DUF1289 domain-containing protein [Litorivivens sp.]
MDEDDLCMGCYRTMQEITDWSEYTNEVKREVIVRAQQRMKRRYNIS